MLELAQGIGAFVMPYLPAAARVAAMMAVAPGLSFQQVPARFRVMFAAVLAVVVAPLAGGVEADVVAGPERFVAVVVSEVFMGGIVGLSAALVIEAARYGASFIELQAGLRAGEVFDPAQATVSSLVGRFYYLTAVVVFFALGGHRVLIGLVCESLRVLPPGAIQWGPAVGKLAVDFVAASFWLALGLGLPTMAALLLTDLSFGLVARVVSNFNVFFVGLPAKLAVTLMGLAISAPLLAIVVARAVGFVVDALGMLGF